jgi:outer membrane protein OmpA-like peptidoglycan-associated protein
MRRMLTIGVTAALVVGSYGCATRAQTGAAVGAGGGAVIGAVIGKATGNTAAGAIIGGVVGGAAGAIIGNYMDQQAADMADIEGAKIERIGEGIKITFAGGLLFDFDKSDVRPDAQAQLVKLTEVLQKYDDTNIMVEGHTDATGTEDYNMDLSLRRSSAVATYLAARGVVPSRLSAVGYGEMQPIASNTTPDGQQQNRRVEIAIWANDDLKAAAKRQAGG